MEKPTKFATSLAERIKKETGMVVIPVVHRTRCGYWQKAQGAWSWSMRTQDRLEIGSQFTATECLKAKKWTTSKAPFSTDTIIDI